MNTNTDTGKSTTVIDAHADVEGKLRGKDAQILGGFQGEIELTGRLTHEQLDPAAEAALLEAFRDWKTE